MSRRHSVLAEGVRARRRPAIAEALNLVEDRRPASRQAMGSLLASLAEAEKAGHRVGLTGPPGVGKSTLAAGLAVRLRRRGRSVGVVAVDPSSVVSGGSLLGDRARMSFDPNDDRMFVRSLATGGEAGGLAWAAQAAVRVLAAAFDVVLVETTGVGQSETDVRHVADTVVLVVQPGSGDTLQFLKAGVMEIPHVLVVNKSDQEALARRALSDLTSALATMSSALGGPSPRVLATSATSGTGIEELIDVLDAHRDELAGTLTERRRRGAVEWTLQLFQRRHGEHGVETLGGADALRSRIDAALSESSAPLVADLLSDAFSSVMSAKVDRDCSSEPRKR